jgi:hypothetical protein
MGREMSSESFRGDAFNNPTSRGKPAVTRWEYFTLTITEELDVAFKNLKTPKQALDDAARKATQFLQENNSTRMTKRRACSRISSGIAQADDLVQLQAGNGEVEPFPAAAERDLATGDEQVSRGCRGRRRRAGGRQREGDV